MDATTKEALKAGLDQIGLAMQSALTAMDQELQTRGPMDDDYGTDAQMDHNVTRMQGAVAEVEQLRGLLAKA